MHFDKEQLDVFLGELEKSGPSNIPCILCGGRSFSIPSYDFEMPSLNQDGEVIATFSVIPCVCDACGDTRFFSTRGIEQKRVNELVKGGQMITAAEKKSVRGANAATFNQTTNSLRKTDIHKEVEAMSGTEKAMFLIYLKVINGEWKVKGNSVVNGSGEVIFKV